MAAQIGCSLGHIRRRESEMMALGQLPRKAETRRADVLRLVKEGHTYAEIAAMLGRSLKGVQRIGANLVREGRMESPYVYRRARAIAKAVSAAETKRLQAALCALPVEITAPPQIWRPPGTLYREVMDDGRLSPYLSITPSAEDGRPLDWRKLMPPPAMGGSPAGAMADMGVSASGRRQPSAERAR
jgi:DNA-binding CsgD family transcriptional regulator